MDEARHDEQWYEMLSAYADGECSPDEQRLVRAHLARCPQCRQWLEQVAADRELFTETLVSSARGKDLSGQITEEISNMPIPEQPTQEMPGIATAEPSGGGTMRIRFALIEVLVVVVICATLAAILFPTFARSREKARQTSCQSNLKQIMLAALMYAGDYDGRLPDASHWPEQLLPYHKNKHLYVCPTDETGAKVSYAMNPRYSGADTHEYPDAAELIVFFDADETGAPVARHHDGTNCGFMDGHVKWMKGVPDQLSPTTGFAPPTHGYGLADRLKIAYTASAEIWVRSIYQALLAAEAAVSTRGGFLLQSRLEARYEPYSAQITCRVPTDEVANAVNDLGELGWVAQREIQGTDLTRNYLDNRRAVATQTARRERLTTTLRRAGTKEHVVQLEENLAGSEAAQNLAEGELYGVAGRTTLATITATLTQREREPKRAFVPLATTARSALGAIKSVGILLARGVIWGLAFVWLWGPVAWYGIRALRQRRSTA